MVSSDGSKITNPRFPSTIIDIPCLTLWVISFKPTTAGISRLCATSAVCEVLPPISVTKPFTITSFILTVSAGVRFLAIIIEPSSKSIKLFLVLPRRFLIIFFATSKRSCFLSLKYSLSIKSKVLDKFSTTSCKAYSAFVPLFINFFISSLIIGSFKISKCASAILA